ncbi:ethyl tert-butyl ether degradation protein EthD [Azospirillum thiophilum]|uniref:Ethyl tert-butyl ether degradation protein EthD n=1 Tax=Azospirillum thiophilum TaxID=528244 RepID=A0AAC8W492_9PROT|nr:EthD domain-containing protein [Azospirillum thiophilum]ALG74820.1 ethyl tert-butyl ether degradation protein EthD [Azospirillum thiophilum]KJR61645.1 ethyl tert-butyl ether degradation protein EthD [Azospirillum thiophilum]
MIKIILGFKRRQGMSLQEFKDYRRDVHAPLLFAIPEAKKIRRFVVSYPVSAPRFPEPSYDAVVEAWFDSLEDMNDLYFCENFRTKVDPDHANFIDLASVGRVISEEIVVIE